MVEKKHIILGVSGSIAAYKAVYLTRLFVEARAHVWPMLTAAGARFVGPLTFSALTGNRAVTDMWSASEAGEINHVELAHRADLLVLAPATADLLARLALGRADDPLAAVALSTQAPWLVAPAMESGMWNNPATQKNVETLRERGAQFVMPTAGRLASGATGVGRMAEPEDIFEAALGRLTSQDLHGKKVVVTAGPTREYFDPVRFISNPSSGKMGFAVARVARRRGAEVVLITGPSNLVPPPDVHVDRIETTAELLTACQNALQDADILVMAAAPGDFSPASRQTTKSKKPTAAFQAALEPTVDVLKTLAPRKAGCFVVGFAAETHDVNERAKAKLEAKDLDLVVANDITLPDAGFGTDTNVVTIISRDGSAARLPALSKVAVAEEILDRVVTAL
ncbi:MAG: hypothetical protein A2289_19840 [Deltaproteobacteria bacterium RIFOXYA12_FULL_58_15]|nr:MAG: hypothetical protein A2289_19840 [Deltaproteobacteria bacterium RIFOXYA12_FULL_58_15]OGR11478.1 MAG: hypothetical protein A2341_12565 [Deltaproteobacteria bacterium RIFOXYB12_FULL_58_9]